MLLPEKIARSDMLSASLFFTRVRFRHNSVFSFGEDTPFKSLELISQFFERVLIRLKDDPNLNKKVSSFRRRLSLNTTFDRDLEQEMRKIKVNKFVNQIKYKTLVIEKEVKLKRVIRGHRHIFLRLEFVPYFKGYNLSRPSKKRFDSVAIEKVHYQSVVSVGLSDQKHSFDYNDCLEFDDRNDIEFEEFYRSALKHWKRKLCQR